MRGQDSCPTQLPLSCCLVSLVPLSTFQVRWHVQLPCFDNAVHTWLGRGYVLHIGSGFSSARLQQELAIKLLLQVQDTCSTLHLFAVQHCSLLLWRTHLCLSCASGKQLPWLQCAHEINAAGSHLPMWYTKCFDCTAVTVVRHKLLDDSWRHKYIAVCKCKSFELYWGKHAQHKASSRATVHSRL